MENEIRRSLDELVVRYELEPELCDIYVEGKTDKLLLEWFLEQKGREGFAVYEIDTVDIPAQRLFELGLNDGKRGRVIALALDLQNRLLEIPPHLTCIADKDFDWLFDIEYVCDLLLFTDYTCLEMYLFNEAIIDKFLRLSLRLTKLKARDVIHQLSRVLEEFFLIRATNELLKLNMEWLEEFGRCCQIKDNNIHFELEKFIEKYLNKNGNMSLKTKFVERLEKLRSKEVEDIRCKINGHDFTNLLFLYVKPFISREIRNSYNSEILARSLFLCIDVEQLAQEGLFRQILSRVETRRQLRLSGDFTNEPLE